MQRQISSAAGGAAPCCQSRPGRQWATRPPAARRPPAQHAERCNASRLVLVAEDEWARGCVRVKDLASRQEADVPLDQL